MTTIWLSGYVFSPFLPITFVKQVCHTTGIICLSSFLEALSSKFSLTLGSMASAAVKALASRNSLCSVDRFAIGSSSCWRVSGYSGYPLFWKTNMSQQISIPNNQNNMTSLRRNPSENWVIFFYFQWTKTWTEFFK